MRKSPLRKAEARTSILRIARHRSISRKADWHGIASHVIKRLATTNDAICIQEAPSTDSLLVHIPDYVTSEAAFSEQAHAAACGCLLDALACALEATTHSECGRLMEPYVLGTHVPQGKHETVDVELTAAVQPPFEQIHLPDVGL